jgi:hypothetical protein
MDMGCKPRSLSKSLKFWQILVGRIIIAPEGLSRFYRKGFSGDVVASWMTKDDRLDDMEDYVRYLNDLHLAHPECYPATIL